MIAYTAGVFPAIHMFAKSTGLPVFWHKLKASGVRLVLDEVIGQKYTSFALAASSK